MAITLKFNLSFHCPFSFWSCPSQTPPFWWGKTQIEMVMIIHKAWCCSYPKTHSHHLLPNNKIRFLMSELTAFVLVICQWKAYRHHAYSNSIYLVGMHIPSTCYKDIPRTRLHIAIPHIIHTICPPGTMPPRTPLKSTFLPEITKT